MEKVEPAIPNPGFVIIYMQYNDTARNKTQLANLSARTDNVEAPEGTTNYTYNNSTKQLTGIA